MSITPESVQALLASEEYRDRLTALNQLRQLDPAVAFQLIQPAISDPHTRIRYAAVSQLATLGEQDRSLALEILRDRLHNDSEIDVKAAAADALGALRFQEAFEDLEAMYHSNDDWLLQLSIIAVLGVLGHPAGFELLQTALTSSTELVRTAAITAFGELGDERAIPLLLPLVSDEDWQVRCRVAQSLSYFKTPEARAALEILAQDPMEQVAAAARAQAVAD